MNLMIEKLFDIMIETEKAIFISYGTYAVILYVLYLIFIKDKVQWVEYLKIPRWALSIFITVMIPIIAITCFLKLPQYVQGQQLGIIGFTIVIELLIFIYLKKCPSKEKQKLDKLCNEEGNPIKKYQKLLEFEEFKLTPAEKKMLNQQIYFTLYELGYLKQAEAIMKKVEEENSSRYLMFESIVAENRGELNVAHKLMEAALLKCQADKGEHYLQIQLWNNMGRIYRIEGNYREALTYYKQALDRLIFPKEKGIAKEIYINYIFALSMLKTPWEEIEKVIKEYENHLDIAKPENYIQIMNIRIEAAKQAGKEEIWKKEILQGFHEVIKKGLSWEQRLVFEATSLRLAHTSGVNFIAPLEAIKKDIQMFTKLEMPTRYYMIKEIHILFQPHSRVPLSVQELYTEVREFANKYMCKQASKDISEYLNGLPLEAILARGKMQTELAFIQKHQTEDWFEMSKDILLSVRNMYETNGQMLEALRTDINLADQHFMIEILDDELMPKYRKSLEEIIDYADKYLSILKSHPALADMFGQMAWMYLRLHKYEKSVQYMDRYNACSLSEEHFVTWFKSQIGAVRFIKEVLRIKNCLEELKQDSKQLQNLSKEAREWIKRYPNKDSSLEVTLLWGGLLGFERIYAKRKTWVSRQNDQLFAKEYYWLCINEVIDEENKMCNTIYELDMTYDSLLESEESRMLFIPQKHPFETGKSMILRREQEESGMRMPYVEGVYYSFPHVDKNGKRTVLDEICKCVESMSS